MDDIERRIASLEARQSAHTYIVSVLTVACIANAGMGLWAVQSISDTKMDTIAFSLTVLQVFLAIIALGGFWLFRDMVQKRAEEISDEVTKSEVTRIAPPIIRREVEAYRRTLRGGESDDGTAAQTAAIGQDEAEDG